MSDALLIAAHGSRDESGLEEFWDFADAWQALRPDRSQAAGFLEFARPTIGEAVDELIDRGAKRIIVVPAMLMAAGHVKNDVPSEIHEARERHPTVTLRTARPLDIHAAVLELCHVRYREAINGLPDVPANESMLLLVGRGTSDPDANANIARVSRFLWESYGLRWASVAYSGVTAPGVDEALSLCGRLGFRRIVVQPYFLFDGVLVKRVHEAAERHSEADPATQIVRVEHLRTHPLLIQAFEERVHEAAHGPLMMSCDLCKYRVSLIGREHEVGTPIGGNHHHVRAVETEDHVHRPYSSVKRPALSATLLDATHPWDERLLRRLELVN
jgi:sirohydrochlorin cobaltochelatase